jgi:hypothetical protein
MTPCARHSAPPAPPLIHIRRGYVTACQDLRLTVETGGEGWSAEVRDVRNGGTLYNARRCSLDAAKVALTEFAMFRAPARPGQTPERLARELSWTEYW